METKKAIRKQMQTKRNELLKEQREAAERRIFESVISMKEFKQSSQILLYMAHGSEVSTKALLSYCLQSKKEIFCPRVTGEGEMDFFRIEGLADFQKGYQQILEPVTTAGFVKQGESLMVLPLVAFDEEKNRLGYGKGYYDRYLQRAEGICTCGIAFECQKWQGRLPVDAYDRQLNKIITESFIYE